MSLDLVRRSLRIPLVAAALVGGLALAGCAGGGAVAPVSTASTGAAGGTNGAPAGEVTAYPEIDAIRAALGGDWTRLQELPHSACTPEGGEPDSGMQNVATTSSQASRSAADALAAAQLAAEALTEHGYTVSQEPTETGGTATVSASIDGESTITVTVDGTQATIDYRTLCIVGSEQM